MKLSLRSEYALLALIHLGRNSKASSLSDIATTLQLPQDFLLEVLTVLCHSQYVLVQDSAYSLTKSPGSIIVSEIIRLFDGALAPLEPVSSKGYAVAPMDKEEKLVGLFENLQEMILTRLDGTTIEQLI